MLNRSVWRIAVCRIHLHAFHSGAAVFRCCRTVSADSDSCLGRTLDEIITSLVMAVLYATEQVLVQLQANGVLAGDHYSRGLNSFVACAGYN
jgi:hypothetical protein